MKKIFPILTAWVKYMLIPVNMYAQSVAINNDGSPPNPRSILDLKSTSKGLFLPRMTSLQRLTIPVQSDDVGLLVFDLEKNCLYMYDGVQWLPINSGYPGLPYLIPRIPSDATGNEHFGESVSIHGDFAIVGAPGAKVGTNFNQGAAYIFTRSGGTWIQQAKLVATDGMASDRFGVSVSINGNYAVVGATLNGMPGAAYAFVRNGNTWTQQTKITASDGLTGDNFGAAVSIHGEYVVVGAPKHNIGSSADRGAAYIFVRIANAWVQEAKLTAPDGLANDQFGYSVSINGSYTVIGAIYDDDPPNIDQGSAYVFERSGFNWTMQEKFTAGEQQGLFGTSVSINGNLIAVGAPGVAAGLQEDAGRVYTYVRDGSLGWSSDAQVAGPDVDEEKNDGFGSSVSIDGLNLLIGSPGDAIENSTGRGSAWLFKRVSASWSFERKFTDPAGQHYHGLGGAVSISGNSLVLGAKGADHYTGKILFLNLD